MKKAYLLFLLTSCFSLFLFSILNYKKQELTYIENHNNLEGMIDDSINPHCSFKFNNSNRNSINNFKELIFTSKISVTSSIFEFIPSSIFVI